VLYQRFAGIGGITHTLSNRATAFAQARREIPCFGTTHADHFYGPIPVTRPLSANEIDKAYELNTGLVIAERFAALDPLAVPGVLVASHAPFAWGRDAADSVKNAVALEAVAGMALDTLALEPDLGPVEPYLLDKHYFRKHGKDAYYGQSANNES
jgi:L-ribulose-5-phosphate 4-epimerase